MRRMILALLVTFSMTIASSAAAAEGPILGFEGIWNWLASFWSSDQERGLGLDPNGLTVDRGAGIDPDGATWEDRGAGLDPNG